MALPKIVSTVYEMTIPSSKEKVKFRPFLVKEQKALLLAQQSNDSTIMVNTLKDVLKGCIMDNVNVDSLALFDLEYMLLQLRAKSIQEKSDLLFACDECGKETQMSFDVTSLEVVVPEGHTSKIDLGGDVGLMMKYPSIDIMKKLEGLSTEDVNSIFSVVVSCIDYIYDADQVYHSKEQSKEELNDFVESLSSDQFAKIRAFFDTMPKLEHNIDFKCPYCGHQHHKVLSGINSFF